MTDRELMQQALDVMLAAIKAGDWKVDGACDPDYVLEAIRTRLSQCERCGEVNPAEIHTCSPQEPVAWFCELPDNKISIKIVGKPTEGNWKPLYTTPPQRIWQGLTDEERLEAEQDCYFMDEFDTALYAENIEAKLKEKNNG